MKANPTKTQEAFSLFELLVVIAVLMLAAVFFLPMMARSPRPARRVSCVNNLKQTGLAFRIWSGDNNDRYPMSVSTNQGGSMELGMSGDAIFNFQVLSNELSTPKILYCPSDTARHAAVSFGPGFNRTTVSYFVGVDAVETNVTMLLSGDRNITNGTRLHNGFLELTTNRLSGWTAEIHNQAGNVALADGSVQQVSISGLQDAVKNTGVATNRLAIP